LQVSSGTNFGSAPDADDATDAWITRLLHGAASAEAFRNKLVMLSIEAERRIALHPSHRNADQPRTVAGSVKAETDPPATSEATPDQNPTPAADKQPAGKDAPMSPLK
jgi:hypothetical protein